MNVVLQTMNFWKTGRVTVEHCKVNRGRLVVRLGRVVMYCGECG